MVSFPELLGEHGKQNFLSSILNSRKETQFLKSVISTQMTKCLGLLGAGHVTGACCLIF